MTMSLLKTKQKAFVLDRGQANFRGPVWFETKTKAKDLTLEAKAKDFKNCPRGQGRPRGRQFLKCMLTFETHCL